MSTEMREIPSIPEFFRNKTIFITGGSGFIGKVLIEKLLRSCPDLKTIYLLMRPKKGKTPHERIKIITDLPLFDLLKTQNPAALDKIKLIPGDVKELNLGLTADDRRLLIAETNVIFHGAASVRFDDSLTDAVLMNVRGTREVVQLALQVENLDSFLHISTTFCNVDRKVIGEQIYPAHADWEKTIEIAENADKHTLNILTAKYIAPLPNTYTFSKSLAEHVVYDLAKGKIPTVIFRPSIVISTAYEPMPGWIDNFNGPVGLFVAIGKGVVRTVHADPETVMDHIPVDLVAKAIIISTWKQATIADDRFETTFYNGSNNDIRNINMKQIAELGKQLCGEVPLEYILWYPNCNITKCFYYHWIMLIFYQLIPAIVLDGVLKLLKYEPLLMRVQRRIYTSITALEYFAQNRWKFLNDNVLALEDHLEPCDFEDFSYHKERVDIYEFFKNASIGGKKYLLKEPDDNWEAAKTNNRRMWILYQIFNVLWYFALFWLIFVKIDVISVIYRKYDDAYIYLTTD